MGVCFTVLRLICTSARIGSQRSRGVIFTLMAARAAAGLTWFVVYVRDALEEVLLLLNALWCSQE